MRVMFDFEIAFYLYKISKILAIFENNKYKSEAYYNAAKAVDAYDTYITFVNSNDGLTSINGIGVSSAKLIKEIIETGSCQLLTELENKYSIKDYSLILVAGLSNKIIKKLFDNQICDFNSLANRNDFASLGFSSTELRQINDFIKDYKKADGLFLYPYAYCIGMQLVEHINEKLATPIVAYNTRWCNKVHNVALQCLESKREYIIKKISQSKRYNDVKYSKGEITCRSVFGIPIILTLVKKLDAKESIKFLRGDLHAHTTWSDGIHTIEQMVRRAKNLGYEYIGITDHSYSLRVANGISETDTLRYIDEIRALKEKDVKVFAGIEVEVLKDGSLDFSDAILSQFDYVIAGIHTYLNQSHDELKLRIEKALSNPYVNVFAHPSSRLLGRPGVLFSDRNNYAVEMDEIISLCKKYDVAIEFNCFPERFDVDVKYFDDILKNGLMISVGSDSHSAAHLNCLTYAEEAIKNSFSIKKNVLNTMNFFDLKRFFSSKRERVNIASFKEISRSVQNFDYFFGNNSAISNGDYVAIGIDLTGSETKPSGWAALKGSYATTKMLYSDDEIIEESLKINPKIISIDSPLSRPYMDVGITRYCERLLASFGIHAYPCLIPSMVNLTNRGMRLAAKFRDLGVEVIESYPGAAQDILCIRRKQNGLIHLKNGYRSFGITGEYYDSETIKHDELDAIMSAVVGLFYLNDQYVALGNIYENFLIVPSIAKAINPPVIIGLAGETGAGKTTLAEYLKFKFGFRNVSYNQITQKEYGDDSDNDALQLIDPLNESKDIRKSLTMEIINRIKEDGNRSYVVDGISQKIDMDIFKSYFGENFLFVYIDSSLSNRYKRYCKTVIPAYTKEEFIKKCNEEIEIFNLRFLSDMIIRNDKTYKDFFGEAELYLKEYVCR